MGIGILTASRTDNIGTDMQALAMQWLFSTDTKNAELISYYCSKLENSRKTFYPHNVRGLVKIPYKLERHRAHEAFRKQHFIYSKEAYNEESIAQNKYNTIVVGSDQIWNLDIVGNDLSFFLPYKNSKQKKYAFAPSLGRTDIKNWNEKFQLSEKISDFDEVTVREASGVKALADIGVSAVQVLDPLLMHPAKKWLDVAETIKQSKPYVFVYCVDRSDEAIQLAKEYAARHDMDVVVYGFHLKPISGIKSVRVSSIGQWLTYMNKAAVIITNSYHGLSFVMNFHKPFAMVWLNKNKQSNTRMESLLNLAGIVECEDKQIVTPDWVEVDRRLESLRQKSKEYVQRVVDQDGR